MIIEVVMSVPGRLWTTWTALRGLSNLPAASGWPRLVWEAPTDRWFFGSQNLKISIFLKFHVWELLQARQWGHAALGGCAVSGEAAEGGPGRPQTSRDTHNHLDNHKKALGRARGDQSYPWPNVSQSTYFSRFPMFLRGRDTWIFSIAKMYRGRAADFFGDSERQKWDLQILFGL
jgi:hypothetical protein